MIVLFHMLYYVSNIIWNRGKPRLFQIEDTDKDERISKDERMTQLYDLEKSPNGCEDSNEYDDYNPDKDVCVYDLMSGKLTFVPPLYIQRYQAVMKVLTEEENVANINTIAEFGCAEFQMLKYYKKLTSLRQVLFVDIDAELLTYRSDRVSPLAYDYLVQRETELNVDLYCGDVSVADQRMMGADVVVAIELIEHLYPPTLENVPYNIFGTIQPHLAIVTTPNGEFNHLFDDYVEGTFRHDDHKFEWTRGQFKCWAENIVSRYPMYTVQISGIGPPPACKSEARYGHCSQMAVFTRNGDRRPQVTPPVPEPYRFIKSVTFPVKPPETRSQEQILFDEMTYLLFSWKTDLVPLRKLYAHLSPWCSGVEELREILERNCRRLKYNAEDGEYYLIDDSRTEDLFLHEEMDEELGEHFEHGENNDVGVELGWDKENRVHETIGVDESWDSWVDTDAAGGKKNDDGVRMDVGWDDSNDRTVSEKEALHAEPGVKNEHEEVEKENRQIRSVNLENYIRDNLHQGTENQDSRAAASDGKSINLKTLPRPSSANGVAAYGDVTNDGDVDTSASESEDDSARIEQVRQLSDAKRKVEREIEKLLESGPVGNASGQGGHTTQYDVTSGINSPRADIIPVDTKPKSAAVNSTTISSDDTTGSGFDSSLNLSSILIDTTDCLSSSGTELGVSYNLKSCLTEFDSSTEEVRDGGVGKSGREVVEGEKTGEGEKTRSEDFSVPDIVKSANIVELVPNVQGTEIAPSAIRSETPKEVKPSIQTKVHKLRDITNKANENNPDRRARASPKVEVKPYPDSKVESLSQITVLGDGSFTETSAGNKALNKEISSLGQKLENLSLYSPEKLGRTSDWVNQIQSSPLDGETGSGNSIAKVSRKSLDGELMAGNSTSKSKATKRRRSLRLEPLENSEGLVRDSDPVVEKIGNPGDRVVQLVCETVRLGDQLNVGGSKEHIDLVSDRDKTETILNDKTPNTQLIESISVKTGEDKKDGGLVDKQSVRNASVFTLQTRNYGKPATSGVLREASPDKRDNTQITNEHIVRDKETHRTMLDKHGATKLNDQRDECDHVSCVETVSAQSTVRSNLDSSEMDESNSVDDDDYMSCADTVSSYRTVRSNLNSSKQLDESTCQLDSSDTMSMFSSCLGSEGGDTQFESASEYQTSYYSMSESGSDSDETLVESDNNETFLNEDDGED